MVDNTYGKSKTNTGSLSWDPGLFTFGTPEGTEEPYFESAV